MNPIRKFQVTFFYITMVLFLAASGSAQDKPEQQPDLRIETIEARIPLRAWDAYGKRVTNLKPQDIVVIENGEGRQVTSLKQEAANVLLVLDHSVEFGLMKNGRPRLQEESGGRNRLLTPPATVDFAESLLPLLGEADHLAILQYSDQVELIQPWTTNRREALQALRAKVRQGDKTRLYDALLRAAETLQQRPAGRRVLILVTDGIDTASQTQKQAAITALARTGATLFIVSLAEFIKQPVENTKPDIVSGHGGTPQDTASARVNINISPWVFKRNKELNKYTKKVAASAKEWTKIAENSGGEIYRPKNFDELITLPIEIMREVGAQYTVTYLTERKPNEAVLRKLEILGARSITVRAPQQYYTGAQTPKEESKK
ncbi:MAG TPA: VWA domain-containing protein [Blastocatellia bacterium]|nr:VWA domain-containing protein [Blastocatellia bacterium]